MNKAVEAKPCPFCGSHDIIWGTCNPIMFDSFVYVKCRSCGAVLELHDNPLYCSADAVKAWNKRAGERNGKE